MKIAIASGIFPPESGGPASYVAALAPELVRQGHEVLVVTYGEKPSVEKKDGYRIYRISRRFGPFVRYLRFTWRLIRSARNPDLIYAQGPISEGVPAAIAAFILRRPLLMKVVGDSAWEMAQQAGETDLLDPFLTKKHHGKIGLYERFERWTANSARRIIVPSQYLKTVVERWGIPSDKIKVILNATEALPSVKSRDEERQTLQIEATDLVAFTAVRAVPWKGIAELISWWQDLPPTHHLVIAGEGPCLSDWKKLAVQNNLQNRVHFLGRQPRHVIAQWIEAADAFLLHSGYEGYPHVVAEACSRGLPCLISDQGGNPETKQEFGDLITILPYQNKSAWISALLQLQPHRVARMTPSHWSFAQLYHATEQVLSETISTKKRSL